jgi:hypothetical protein
VNADEPTAVDAASESSLTAEYRRLLRWYPKQWRQANEQAMLGALLDQAEGEGREASLRAERTAIAKAGLAQRAGLRAHTTSPLTLALGGAGILLASIVPFVDRALFIFPAVQDLNWFNRLEQSDSQELSAGILVVAFALLAFGFRAERGIAGRSVIGKAALILFAAPNLLVVILDSGPMDTLPIDHARLAVETAAYVAATYGGLAGLLVAALIVLRAQVVRGVARFGLPLLALMTALPLAIGHVHSQVIGHIVFWDYSAGIVVLLAIGVLFLVQGASAALRNRYPIGINRA